jgi:hypothetical protein
MDEKRKLRNARYYERNKERLQKLNKDKYYANKEIILERKKERYHAKKQNEIDILI